MDINKNVYFSSLLLLVCLWAATGCTDNDFRTGTIRVCLRNTDSTQKFPLDSFPVVVTNRTLGSTYTALTDAQGRAELQVPPGSCSVATRRSIRSGLTEQQVSGTYADLPFRGDAAVVEVELPLTAIRSSILVIDEVYFGGSPKPGGSLYISDQYLTLGNNGDETLYLDGLCVAQAAPSTTSRPSSWRLHTDMAEIPLFMMCWQFPGGGTDYPLLPGKRQVIATNAIDHRAGAAGVATALDLSHADWSCYNPRLTSSKITAGIKPLDLVWYGSGNSFSLTVSGPSVLIFMPEEDMAAWASNPAHIRKEPESVSKMQYLHIPTAWVLGVANFVSSVQQSGNNRLPNSLDPEPGVAGPVNTGMAWRRIHKVEEGRIRWESGSTTFQQFYKAAPSLQVP